METTEDKYRAEIAMLKKAVSLEAQDVIRLQQLCDERLGDNASLTQQAAAAERRADRYMADVQTLSDLLVTTRERLHAATMAWHKAGGDQ